MPHLIDRTRVETDWTCERRRYWANEHDKSPTHAGGVSPVEDALELKFGSALHSALSSLALGVLDHESIAAVIRADITAGYAAHSSEKIAEAQCLAEGLWWAFLRSVWPSILADYEIIWVERELTLPFGDPSESMAVMVKPDLVVRRKSDNTIWYLEYKTTGFKTQNWLEGWRYAVQLHAGCMAVERELDQPVEGAIIIGLYKGYPKDGKVRSPFTWAYHLEGIPGVVPDRWNTEWVRGWDLTSVAHYPAGMKAWVDSLSDEQVTDQFAITGPISMRRDIVETFLKQQGRRERMVLVYHKLKLHGLATVDTLDEIFPQRFKSCRPLIGRPCPYIECCFSPRVAADPVGTGLYTPREPHHMMEIAAMEEAQ